MPCIEVIPLLLTSFIPYVLQVLIVIDLITGNPYSMCV